MTKDWQEFYYAAYESKDPKVKYKNGLEVAKHYAEKGDVSNTHTTLENFVREQAEQAGISKKKVDKTICKITRLCFEHAVPKLFSELTAEAEKKKANPSYIPNFKYIDNLRSRIFDYAVDSKCYNARQLCRLNERLDELKEQIYGSEMSSGNLFAGAQDTDADNWEVSQRVDHSKLEDK